MRRYAYAPGDAYDQPPDTDPAPDVCERCGEQFETADATQCVSCGYGEAPEEPDDHDLACDRDRDDAFDKECER